MLKTTKSGATVRWSSSVVTMYVDEKLDELFGSTSLRAALTMATEAWRGLPGVPDLVIGKQKAQGYLPSQRTNGIYLVSPWPYAHSQLAVTVTTYNESGQVLGVDVLVNAEHSFAVLPESTDAQGVAQHDLGAVLTHEFGHVLGLGESPTDRQATMWPYIGAGEVHQRSLAKDDEEGVMAAYADQVVSSAAGCGQASVVGSLRKHQTRAPIALLGAAFVCSRTRRRGSRKH